MFKLISKYKPSGDQPKAIKELVDGLNEGKKEQVLLGATGTGKTFTASVIASELDLPLYTVQMDKVVTKFMGETSTKLRQIFDTVATNTGVYFFDEFDAIGADRSLDNEVGEARRILNCVCQLESA